MADRLPQVEQTYRVIAGGTEYLHRVRLNGLSFQVGFREDVFPLGKPMPPIYREAQLRNEMLREIEAHLYPERLS